MARPRFCCDCGEEIAPERRARWGGPRCKGCRAVAGRRPALVRALTLVIAGAVGFWAGAASAPDPVAPAPVAVAIPASAEPTPPPPPPEPQRPCGARTKKGTRCKRMIRGEGPCWQHKKE